MAVPSLPRAWLHVLDPESLEPMNVFPACGDVLTVGRSGSVDVRIHLATVSKAHCFFDLSNHSLVVTSINPVKVEQADGTVLDVRSSDGPVVIQHGSIIRISIRVFRYDYAPEMVAEEDRSVDMGLVAQAVVDTPAPPPRVLRRSPRRSTSPDRRSESPVPVPVPLEDEDVESEQSFAPMGIYEDVVRQQTLQNMTDGRQSIALAPVPDDSDSDDGQDPFADPAGYSSSDIPDQLEDDSDSDSEIESLLISPRVAAAVPLPDSPEEPLAQSLLDPSSPTPMARAQSSPLPDRLPSKGPSRRLSLREKLLVRSAVNAHMSRSNSAPGLATKSPSPPPRSSSFVVNSDPIVAVPILAPDVPTPAMDLPCDVEPEEDAFADADEVAVSQSTSGHSARSPSPPPSSAPPQRLERSPSPTMPGAMPVAPRSPSPPPPVESDEPPSPSVFGAYRDLTVAIPLTEPQPSVYKVECTPPRRSRRSSGHQPTPVEPPVAPSTPVNPETDVHRRLTPRKSALKLVPADSNGTEDASDAATTTPVLKRKRSSVSFNAEIQLMAIPHRTESDAEARSPVKQPRLMTTLALEVDPEAVVPLSPVPSPRSSPAPELAPPTPTPAPAPALNVPSSMLFNSPGRLDALMSSAARTPNRAKRAPTTTPPLAVQQAILDEQQQHSSATSSSARKPGRLPVKSRSDLPDAVANFVLQVEAVEPVGDAVEPPRTLPKPRRIELPTAPQTVAQPSRVSALKAKLDDLTRRQSLPSSAAMPTSPSFTPRIDGLRRMLFAAAPSAQPPPPPQPSFSPEVFPVVEPAPTPVEVITTSAPEPEPVRPAAVVAKASAIPTANRAKRAPVVTPAPRELSTRRSARNLRTASSTASSASSTRSVSTPSDAPAVVRRTATATSRAQPSAPTRTRTTAAATRTKAAPATADVSPTTRRATAAAASRKGKENVGGATATVDIVKPAPTSRSGRPLRPRA